MTIILCIPGNNFSGKFVDCLVELTRFFYNNSIDFLLFRRESNNIYMARNMCLGGNFLQGINQKPFGNRIKYDYLLWIDSDQTFTYKDVKRLLSHNEDIVSGYYTFGDGTNGLACGKWDLNFIATYGYVPFYTEQTLKLASRNEKELVEVDYIGFGFVLVKYGVFESLSYPWFEPHYTQFKKGNMMIKEFTMEDIGWCLKVKEKGYKIYVDPLVKVGHEKKLVL